MRFSIVSHKDGASRRQSQVYLNYAEAMPVFAIKAKFANDLAVTGLARIAPFDANMVTIDHNRDKITIFL